jgi:hypothetical protein
MADRTVPFDSTASTVKWLRAKGITLGIVSTKPSGTTPENAFAPYKPYRVLADLSELCAVIAAQDP